MFINWKEGLILLQRQYSPNQYKVNAISMKIPAAFFAEIDKLTLKFK